MKSVRWTQVATASRGLAVTHTGSMCPIVLFWGTSAASTLVRGHKKQVVQKQILEIQHIRTEQCLAIKRAAVRRHYDMDEPWQHCTEWQKPDTHRTRPKDSRAWRQNAHEQLLGAGAGAWGNCSRVRGFHLGWWKRSGIGGDGYITPWSY